MTVIYLFTVLYLTDADTFNHTVISLAYKDKATCLEKLDEEELKYRRATRWFVVERYTRTTNVGSKSVEGFSAYDKVDKSKSFYECESTFLLD